MKEQFSSIFGVLETMQSALKCSICLDLLHFPVTTKCGHSFCGLCIDQTLSRSKIRSNCPLCMTPMTRRSLKQNKKIISLVQGVRNIISSFKEDLGYIESYKEKSLGDQSASSSTVQPKDAGETLARRGTRKREQVVPFSGSSPGSRQNLPTTTCSKICKTASGAESSDAKLPELASISGAKRVNLKSTGDSIAKSRKTTNAKSIKTSEQPALKNLHSSSAESEELQPVLVQPEPISKEQDLEINSVKVKVKQWLDSSNLLNFGNDFSEELDEFPLTHTTTDESTKLPHFQDSGVDSCTVSQIPTSARQLHLYKNDNELSSQATTVFFPQKLIKEDPYIDNTIRSQANPDQATSKHTDVESVAKNDSFEDLSRLVTNSESDTKSLADEKENNKKYKSLLPTRLYKRRGCKRFLTEPNTAEIGTEKPSCSLTSEADSPKEEPLPELDKDDNVFKDDSVFLKSALQIPSKSRQQFNKSKGIPDPQIIDVPQRQIPNSKGHNIRFASEIKCKLLEKTKPARLTIKKKTRKSPGWSHIESVKRDLRSRHTSLNITGGVGKNLSDSSKVDATNSVTESSQESVIIIDDLSQETKAGKMNEKASVTIKRQINAFTSKAETSGKMEESCPQGMVKVKENESTITCQSASKLKQDACLAERFLMQNNSAQQQIFQTESKLKKRESEKTYQPKNKWKQNETKDASQRVSKQKQNESKAVSQLVNKIKRSESEDTCQPVSKQKRHKSEATSQPLSKMKQHKSEEASQPVSKQKQHKSAEVTSQPMSKMKQNESEEILQSVNRIKQDESEKTSLPMSKLKRRAKQIVPRGRKKPVASQVDSESGLKINGTSTSSEYVESGHRLIAPLASSSAAADNENACTEIAPLSVSNIANETVAKSGPSGTLTLSSAEQVPEYMCHNRIKSQISATGSASKTPKEKENAVDINVLPKKHADEISSNNVNVSRETAIASQAVELIDKIREPNSDRPIAESAETVELGTMQDTNYSHKESNAAIGENRSLLEESVGVIIMKSKLDEGAGRKSFDLTAGTLTEDRKKDKGEMPKETGEPSAPLLNTEPTIISKEVSTQIEPGAADMHRSHESHDHSVVCANRNVPFQMKGHLNERNSGCCQHSLPCDLFQAFMKFAHYMVQSYSVSGDCYAGRNIPASTNPLFLEIQSTHCADRLDGSSNNSDKGTVNSSTVLDRNEYVINRDEGGTQAMQSNFFEDVGIDSESILPKDSTHLPQHSSNVSSPKLTGCSGERELDDISEISEHTLSSNGCSAGIPGNRSPQISVTSDCEIYQRESVALRDELGDVAKRQMSSFIYSSPVCSREKLKDVCEVQTDILASPHSQFSDSILPNLQPSPVMHDNRLVNKSPDECKIAEETSLYFTLSGGHSGVSKMKGLKDRGPNKLHSKNSWFDTESQGISPQCSPLPSRRGSKKFKRIKPLDSSDDSSCGEEELQFLPKRQRLANVDSQSDDAKIQCLATSEELRDFERYDENIWEYYRNCPDKNIKSLLVEQKLRRNNTLKDSSETDTRSDMSDLEECQEDINKGKTTKTRQNIIADNSDDEEYIPGTDDVLKLAKADLNRAKVNSKTEVNVNLNDTITLVSQESASKTSSATGAACDLPPSTAKLFQRCNESLNVAEQIIKGHRSSQDAEDLIEKCDTDFKDDVKDVSAVLLIAKESEAGNKLSCSSQSSGTNSVILSTQQTTRVKREVADLKNKISSLEEELTKKTFLLSRGKNNHQRQTTTSEDFVHSSSLENKEAEVDRCTTAVSPTNDPARDRFHIDSDQESEELFKTIPSSLADQETKFQNESSIKGYEAPASLKTSQPLTVVCTGLSNLEIEKVNDLVVHIGGPKATVTNVWTAHVTHVVAKTDSEGTTDRTLKYLLGVAKGVWIVSFSWVADSLASSVLLPEEEYEVLDCSGCPGPSNSRKRSGLLFDNCQFYLVEPFLNISKDELGDLIQTCGGRVVPSSHSFIGSNKGLKMIIINIDPLPDAEILEDLRRSGKVIVAHDWIIDCIGMYSLSSLPSYILGEPSDRDLKESGVTNVLMVETQDIF